MAHTKLTDRKDVPQTELYLRMGDQNAHRYRKPIQNWRPRQLCKMKIVPCKLLQNLFAAKGIQNIAEMPHQPESGDSSYSVGKHIVLDVKEGHPEGKSKEITTLATNLIVEEMIQSNLVTILENMPDISTLESQATRILSHTSSNAFNPVLAVQSAH